MAINENLYVLKSSSGMYYLERPDSISWVSDINKATKFSKLRASTMKSKLEKSYSGQLPVILEKVENHDS